MRSNNGANGDNDGISKQWHGAGVMAWRLAYQQYHGDNGDLAAESASSWRGKCALSVPVFCVLFRGGGWRRRTAPRMRQRQLISWRLPYGESVRRIKRRDLWRNGIIEMA